MAKTNCSNIRKITRQFLCCVPIHDISWQDIFDNLATDYDLQGAIVERTVNIKINLKYPIKIDYQKAFLKEIILRLTNKNVEVHDDIYSAYGRLVALPSQEEYSYKHYMLHENRQITLKESASLISEGTTGLKTWQASQALSEWVLKHKDLFKQKKILELGSGVGLAGLIVAKECSPEVIYLTDCHKAVLNLLCENIKLNMEGTSNDSKVPEFENRSHYNNLGPPHVSVLNLPWEEINEQVCEALGPINVVIAADIVYDKDLFKHLITALNNLSSFCDVQNFLFSCTERNPETLQFFQDKIVEAGFLIKELKIPDQQQFYWPTSSTVKLFSFNK